MLQCEDVTKVYAHGWESDGQLEISAMGGCLLPKFFLELKAAECFRGCVVPQPA